MEEIIYKRKDGRYEIRYQYGYKQDGSIHYNSVYGKTEEEALEKYKLKITEKEQKNDLLLYDKSYLGYDINKWIKSVAIRCKKTTFSNYQYIVNARIIPKFAKIKKKNIDSEFVNNYTYELLNEGLLPKTVKDILIILQQIFKSANIKIDIAMPKVPKKEIQIFKIDEQIKLEKELLDNIDRIKFGIYFSLYTGLRIGEVCALNCKDIDLENKKVYIKKTISRIKNPDNKSRKKTIIVIEEPKSLSSIREIPLPEFILPILEKFCCNQEENNFLLTGNSSFIETRTYFNKYKNILKDIDLKKYNFHALRHTFATRCVENGCDPKTLSEILGHSSVKITLERYVHPTYENKVKLMNQLKPFYK